MSIVNGLLFKKRNVKYQNENYEIFEVVDFGEAIYYSSNEKGKYNILSGNNAGSYANDFYNSINDNGFIFLPVDINRIEALNKNLGDIDLLKNKFKDGNYFYTKDGLRLLRIRDESFLDFLRSIDEPKEIRSKNCGDISHMYDSIKKSIISQDDQIMQILTSLFKNQVVVNSSLDSHLIAKLKENVLICGSTGTGKTEILKIISRLYDVPIVIEDATTLSETGYRGRDVSDMLVDLINAANNDIEKAQKGILVIDEIDKLAEKSLNGENHVSRSGVQRSLLKLLDGSLFYLKDKQFDTSKLTIVAMGAFTDILDSKNSKVIGFNNQDNTSFDYSNLNNDDIVRFGLMRELVGRFSKVVTMNSLSKLDLVKILKESDTSPLNTYKKLFEILEVEFDFSDDFVYYIADLAFDKKCGARSLKAVFDECISSALFSIFAKEYSKISLIRPNSDGKAYVLTRKNK